MFHKNHFDARSTDHSNDRFHCSWVILWIISAILTGSVGAGADTVGRGEIPPSLWQAREFPAATDILWASENTALFRLDLPAHHRGADPQERWWAIELIDLDDATPSDFRLRILDRDGRPYPGWPSRSQTRVTLLAQEGPLFAEVLFPSAAEGTTPPALSYGLRAIQGASPTVLTRDGEPVDEWEEGIKAPVTRDGEPVDEWEEGIKAPVTRDGEPVDEWEEGVKAPVTRDGEPVDEWEEGHRSGRWSGPCPEPRNDADDSLVCATPIDLGGRLGGRLGGVAAGDRVDDRDAFIFELDHDAAIVLESRGDLDLRGRLFDDRGQLLATDDDGGLAGNFRLALELPAGRYVVRIENRAGEGAYRLLSTLGPTGWNPWR